MSARPQVVGIVQARRASARLFGKVLAPIGGHPLLATLFNRIRGAPVDEWWLATTSERDDDLTAAWGEKLGVRVFRGDVDDVLSRFTAILEQVSCEWVLRITADNPFVDAGIVTHMIAQAAGLTSNKLVLGSDPASRRLPLGYVPQLARAEAVEQLPAQIPAGKAHHRTHVLSWLYERQSAVAAFVPPEDWPAHPDWRWTVDTADDLHMARLAFEAFGESTLTYLEMETILRERDDITGSNQHVQQKSLEEG
jgi:spore coat polysaccharide biosynthesis protein SpsF